MNVLARNWCEGCIADIVFVVGDLQNSDVHGGARHDDDGDDDDEFEDL
jgi:hypothetical protein